MVVDRVDAVEPKSIPAQRAQNTLRPLSRLLGGLEKAVHAARVPPVPGELGQSGRQHGHVPVVAARVVRTRTPRRVGDPGPLVDWQRVEVGSPEHGRPPSSARDAVEEAGSAQSRSPGPQPVISEESPDPARGRVFVKRDLRALVQRTTEPTGVPQQVGIDRNTTEAAWIPRHRGPLLRAAYRGAPP